MKKLVTRMVVAVAVATAVLGSVTAANAQDLTFRVSPGRIYAFTGVVYQAELLRVEVRGDGYGRADLDLYLDIRDAYGNLVAVCDDDTDIAQWIPTFTGLVTIRVVIRGPVYGDYSLQIWGGRFQAVIRDPVMIPFSASCAS